MSDNCNHQCSSCSTDCSSNTTKSLLEKPNELSQVKKVIGVISGKGGVGKSMVSSMLATNFQKKGYQTAILDADITGPSIPKVFGITEHAMGDSSGIFPAITKTGIQMMSVNLILEQETDPVLWRGPMINNTVKQFWTDVIWTDVDYMFVDMPPGTGEVAMTVFQSLPVDGIVIVTSPQELVSMIVAKAVKMAKQMNIPILGIIENMSYVECPECQEKIHIFGKSHIEDIGKEYNLRVLGQIPMTPSIAASSDAGNIEDLDVDWFQQAVSTIEQFA